MSGYQGSGTWALLEDAIDDETTSKWVDVRGRTHLVFYIFGTGTTSSGVLTLEESLDAGSPTTLTDPQQPYAGTASAITTVNASTVTGGAMSGIHPAVAAYGFVRVRVSTVIGGGGSVSVALVAV